MKPAILLLAVSVALGATQSKTARASSGGGDPLAAVHWLAGKTGIECSGALETVMLLVQLATKDPAQTDFQQQARARFVSRASHPAVRETAALLGRGLAVEELARFSTFLSPTPYFVLNESEELKDVAALLPGGDIGFNLDRLSGYAKLIREFYWDNRVGQFLRESLPYYQQALKRATPGDSASGSRVLVSPLAPSPRLEFQRKSPRPLTYLVLGD
jgi:hypothetical protein